MPKKNFKFQSDYKYGFVSDIEMEVLEKGLSEKIIKKISHKRNEPDFILTFRLKAYQKLKKMKQPNWAEFKMRPINLNQITYYAEAKKSSPQKLKKEIDKTLKKLDITSQKYQTENVALDFVLDSASLKISFQQKLAKVGVVLCSLQEAIQKYPALIKKHLGKVVPIGDNYWATLNAAVFSDGSFVYVPKEVVCPLELSTYFRMNTLNAGQFERTLIIAEKNSSVSYLEGCSAPAFSKQQLHAAVVELIAYENAEIKYSTVQNWYRGDPNTGKGGVYNFVTKRALAEGRKAKIFWNQVELGAAITWKYPSCILKGEESVGEFYSAALTTHKMQADTGSKMIHLGKKSRSLIISKGIAADGSTNNYRGLVKIIPSATGSRNYTQCDSMLASKKCQANTYPTIEIKNLSSIVEHEASTSKLNEEELFYLRSRGLQKEDAISLVVSGFCKEVIKKLPFEFAFEAEKLLSLELSNSVG